VVKPGSTGKTSKAASPVSNTQANPIRVGSTVSPRRAIKVKTRTRMSRTIRIAIANAAQLDFIRKHASLVPAIAGTFLYAPRMYGFGGIVCVRQLELISDE
jgi:hypothetical protein